MARTADDIFRDINERFSAKTGETAGAVLDMYTKSVAENTAEIYNEIEKNKTPHVWSKLAGEDLDATGMWVNCPRDPDENDSSYKYRLMKWALRNEACNETAIATKLLNPQHAANIEFVPLTNGCGTGTCYVLPREYSEENIKASLLEAQQRIREIASPTPYIDYLIPDVQSVTMEVYLKTAGDASTIKKKITNAIRSYVNSLPPKEYLSIGQINRIGVNIPQVEYFAVLSLNINGQQVNKARIFQEIEKKFIFDSIQWIGDVDDENI